MACAALALLRELRWCRVAGRSGRGAWWRTRLPARRRSPRPPTATPSRRMNHAASRGVRSIRPAASGSAYQARQVSSASRGVISIHGCGAERATTLRKRSGWRAASSIAVKPPQSWPARSVCSIPSASSRAITSLTKTSGSTGPGGASVQPKPRRSGTITRRMSPSRWMTPRHWYQCCGQPWSSSSGSPAPASATCMRSPPASTKRCSTPATAGKSSVTRRRAYGP